MTNRTGTDNDDNQVDVLLEGGPEDIPEAMRKRRVAAVGEKIKVPHRGGYEHFQAAGEANERGSPGPVVYRWVDRTKIAE